VDNAIPETEFPRRSCGPRRAATSDPRPSSTGAGAATLLSVVRFRIERMTATAWPAGELDTYAFIGPARRVELLTAIQRQRAELDAREQVLLHAMHADPMPGIDGNPALDKQWVREDVACAKRISPQTAVHKLHNATDLVTKLPATLALLGAGQISLQHAYRLVEAVRGLPQPVVAKIEARVLPRAPRQTVPQFAASVQRAVLALDPRARDEQVADAISQRRIVFTPQDDGTTEQWSLLPSDAAAAVRDAVDQAADRLKAVDASAPCPRTADQRRADAFVELVLAGARGTTPVAGLRPQVNVTVALSTLLGVDDQPGELDGSGPIPAPLARALAFDPTGTWRRLLTDEAGRLVHVATTTYRPPAAMARHVRLQNRTCCFPGCRRRAARCELDHILAWEDGGRTHPDNLQPLCARHHHLKHETRWKVRRDPDGVTVWNSPTGNTYARPPDELPVDTTSLAAESEADDPPPF
jgi:uncharacterized protein DUF222/HNH endonuclease